MGASRKSVRRFLWWAAALVLVGAGGVGMTAPAVTAQVVIANPDAVTATPRVGNPPQCANFRSQAEAQAFLRRNPRVGRVLEAGTDGIACEGNPAPRDTAPVPLRCADFPSQADAQGYLRANPGRAASLEAGNSGVACAGNAPPRDTAPVRANAAVAPLVAAMPPPAATARPPRCADFRSQAEAQASLRMNPRNGRFLEAGLDGVACEGNPAPRDLNPVADARARCGDFRSQADAQAYLRAVPALAPQLEATGSGIACEGNPPPRDTAPVEAARAQSPTAVPATMAPAPTMPPAPTATRPPAPTGTPVPPTAAPPTATPPTATVAPAPAPAPVPAPASGGLPAISGIAPPPSASAQVNYVVRYYALNDSRDAPKEMRDALLANGFVSVGAPVPGGIALFLPDYFRNVPGYEAMKRDGLIGTIAAVDGETPSTYRLLVRTGMEVPPAEAVPAPMQEGFSGIYDLPIGPYGKGHVAVFYFTRGQQ